MIGQLSSSGASTNGDRLLRSPERTKPRTARAGQRQPFTYHSLVARNARLELTVSPVTSVVAGCFALALTATGCAGLPGTDPPLPEAVGVWVDDCTILGTTNDALDEPQRLLFYDTSDWESLDLNFASDLSLCGEQTVAEEIAITLGGDPLSTAGFTPVGEACGRTVAFRERIASSYPADHPTTVEILSTLTATCSDTSSAVESIKDASGIQSDAREPWGNSGGLINAAEAIVTAEIVELTGPTMTVQPNGNVLWSLDESDRIANTGGGPSDFMPGLRVRITSVLADEGDLRPQVGSEMHLIHSSGFLATGTEYALHLGPEVELPGGSRWLTYAHDLTTDQPADGFRFGTDQIMADIAAARAGDATNLATIIAFNGDIHAGTPRSDTRQALFTTYIDVG